MSEAPRLREGVTIAEESGGVEVRDAWSGARLRLDPAAGRVAVAIDGRRTPDEIRAELARTGAPLSRAEVEDALARLEGWYLLDGDRARARAAVWEAQARAGAAQAPRGGLAVLPEARFDCKDGRGYCCTNGQLFGPLSAEDRRKILAHDWTSIPGVRGPEDLFNRAADPMAGATLTYLRARGGRCVFVTDDDRCRIHERLGADAKPWVCRLFPLVVAESPAGLVAGKRAECRCSLRSVGRGTPLSEHAPALESLVREWRAPISIGRLVPWRGAMAAPFEVADAVREAAVAALGGAGAAGATIEARLAAVRDRVLAVADRLGARPDEEDIADALRVARDPGATPAGPPEPFPGAAWIPARAALLGLLRDLQVHLVRRYFDPRAAEAAGPVQRAACEDTIRATIALSDRLEGGPNEPPAGFPVLWAGPAAVRHPGDATGPVGAIYVDAFRNEIFSWQLACHQSFLPGLAIMAIRFALAKWGARRLASEAGRDEVAPFDVERALLAATDTLRSPSVLRVLLRDEARLLGFWRGCRFAAL